MNAGQPDVEFIEDFSVRHPHGAKQFRLGNFKKPNVRAVEDDRRRIDIAPAHALFDREFGIHCSYFGEIRIDEKNWLTWVSGLSLRVKPIKVT